MMRTGAGRRRENGFTFVEIMVTLLISVIVVAGMYQSFNTLHKWWISSGIQSDQRNNARAGLESFTRDLEMAGYLTTNYGDVNKTGLAITFASLHEIEMDQQRPDNATITAANPVYEPRLVYYHLATDMKSGRQNLYRQIRTQPGLPTPDELVAENVSVFTLKYFKNDAVNPEITGLPPQNNSGSAGYTPGVAVPPSSPLRAIRRIEVTLATKTARTLPFGLPGRDYTLTASVTPQNLASTDEVVADVAPPVNPSGVAVYDTGSCTGKLRVKWDPNSEPDLAGYVVFYGPTDKVVVPVRALANKSLPEMTLSPENLRITKFADSGRAGSTVNAPNTYAIQVIAYDSGGNYSKKATAVAVTGNPDPDVGAFSGGSDTTVNPVKPPEPASLAVAPGASDGQLVITWPAAADATAGYRLYRNTAPFADGHIDDSLQIADEGTLKADVTTWTDAGLTGCQTFYYAVASVNCDETLVSGYLRDSVNPVLNDYAVGSGVPLDTVLPPAPSLAGSTPDVQRAFITLANPLDAACPDFDRTEIFWSRDASPPVHIPDSDAGSPGIFRTRGSQVIVFDSETVATVVPPSLPSLSPGATYNLLAVSYDLCGNPSAPATLALTLPPGSATCAAVSLVPPPDNFTAPRYSSCQPDTMEIGWEYPGRETVPGFVGFRVERTDLSGHVDELTAGPTSHTSWTDDGPLQAGGIYTYKVKATDCLYEADPILNALNGTPLFTIGTIKPGQLQRYDPAGSDSELDAVNFVTTESDVPASYTYHNNVRFFLQNTSLSPMTIKRMAVAWDNPNVVLDRVVIGGAPSSTTAQTVSVGGAGSGGAFTVNAEITDVANGLNSASDAVPVLLRFATASGAVNRLTDMRSETLSLSLWVRNNSLQDVECPAAARLAVDVPRGPMLGGFSQSAPGLFGIDSYEVLGVSGTARDTDVKVPYGIDVNVFGTAFDNSRDLFADGVNRGFTVLKVVGISSAAADPAAIPVMPATGSFFERPLRNISGNRYTIYRTPPESGDALMPQVSGLVNWYYALAVDNTGNWDRTPNPDRGNYAYFQPLFDPCSATPLAPVLTLASTPTETLLSWTAPTHYDNGLSIPGADPLTYDVYIKSAGGDPWPSTPAGANLSGLSFRHTANLLTATYFYMVRAKNTCATPRVSDPSNVEIECEGPSVVDCSLFSVPTTAPYDSPFTLAMSGICAYRNNHVHDDGVVSFRVLSGGTTTNFPAPETYDEGAFAKAVTAVYSGGGGDNVRTTSGSLSVNLVVAGATPCTARTVAITGGDCKTTPNPPTSLTATRGAINSGVAILDWAKPNFNTDGTPLLDLAGYQIDIARCTDTGGGGAACGSWAAWTAFALNDPAAESYTWTGLLIGERFKFRLRAKDTCATPNFSGYTADSATVRVR